MSRRSNRWYVSLLLLLLLSLGGQAAAEEKWGPFRGKIVDAETGEPIQGAVVLMIWYKLVYAVVQTNMEFYDAREAVSGPDGTFEIQRLSPPFFTFRTDGPRWTLFAPGYEFYRQVVTPQTGQALVAPTVIEMRRLKTREELLQKSRGYPSDVPEERIPELIRAINVERMMLDLGPIGPVRK